MVRHIQDAASGVIIRRPNDFPMRTAMVETILRELLRGDTHPREIQTKYSYGRVGSIYSAFARLELKGLATSKTADVTLGRMTRPLRIFTITDLGRDLAKVWGLEK